MKPLFFIFFSMFSSLNINICINHHSPPQKKVMNLEPQTTIYKWLFQLDDSKSLYRKCLFHQTTIYKWLFGVPGTSQGCRLLGPEKNPRPNPTLGTHSPYNIHQIRRTVSSVAAALFLDMFFRGQICNKSHLGDGSFRIILVGKSSVTPQKKKTHTHNSNLNKFLVELVEIS